MIVLLVELRKVCLGTGLYLGNHRQTARDEKPLRRGNLLPGETARKRIAIPRLAINSPQA